MRAGVPTLGGAGVTLGAGMTLCRAAWAVLQRLHRGPPMRRRFSCAESPSVGP